MFSNKHKITPVWVPVTPCIEGCSDSSVVMEMTPLSMFTKCT